MKKVEIIILTILLACSGLQANAKNAADKDLMTADYLYRNLAFAEAIQYYEKVAVDNGDVDVFSRLGDCYLMVKDPAAATVWYSKAVMDPNCNIETKLHYAQALMTVQRYNDAIPYLKQYQAANQGDRRIANMIKSCETAGTMMAGMPNGAATFLSINTDGSEFGPSINGNKLVFTSDSSMGANNKVDKWTGNAYYNIYTVACSDNGRCSGDLDVIKGKVNTKYHDGPAVFTAEGDEMYFTRTNYKRQFLYNGSLPDNNGVVRLQIMVASDYDSATQSFKKVKPFVFNDKNYSTAHPAISPDGKLLVFSSDMPGGEGGSDLYMCTKDVTGSWSAPVSVGRAVNTEGEEMFPFIDNDKTLYFASNGHVGMGGLDVYKSSWNGSGYGTPENLGAPLNSSYDDMSLTLRRGTKLGFFASNRPAMKKGDNIYTINMSDLFLSVKVMDAATGELIPASSMNVKALNDDRTYTGNADGSVTAKILPQAQYAVTISKPGYKSQTFDVSTLNAMKSDTIFKSINLESDFAINYNVVVLDEATMLPIDQCMLVFAKMGSTMSDTAYIGNGQIFKANMEPNEEYHIYAVKNMYYSNERMVSTAGITTNMGQINLKDTLYMKELKVGEVYKIDNIYYDYDKATIRADAKPSLNGLIDLLGQYPEMKIQVNSHTDCRGSDSYNMNLSKARANSVIKYLQQRGISRSRLKFKGYGETMPVETCDKCDDCTEDQHQRNRRTEFQIISM